MVDIIIGDEHGREKFINIYNKIKDRTDIRYIISTGDYFDPYKKISSEDLLNNFFSIVKLAREDSRVKLLLGNHDIHYIVFCDKSRYDYYNAPKYRKALSENIDLFSICIKLDENTIVSHAGVSKKWLEENPEINLDNINEILTDSEKISKYLPYNDSDWSGYGEAPNQSPVWIRPNGLLKGGYPEGITCQIVGHTHTETLSYFGYPNFTTPAVLDKLVFVETGDNINFYERLVK